LRTSSNKSEAQLLLTCTPPAVGSGLAVGAGPIFSRQNGRLLLTGSLIRDRNGKSENMIWKKNLFKGSLFRVSIIKK